MAAVGVLRVPLTENAYDVSLLSEGIIYIFTILGTSNGLLTLRTYCLPLVMAHFDNAAIIAQDPRTYTFASCSES
jgi:hypothetical protein